MMGRTLKPLLVVLSFLIGTTGHAHKRWLLPNDFSLSEAETVTVDFTASNNIFYVDAGMPLKGLTVLSPAGNELSIKNVSEGERRSSFDLKLEKEGTHRLLVRGDPVYFLSYRLPDSDNPYFERGSLQWLKQQVPENASDVMFSESNALIETYLTLGVPTEPAPLPQHRGITLRAITHPNNLYSDEKAEFVVSLHGKPVEGQTVTIVPEGTRYRDGQSESHFTTDAQGHFEVKWQGPGRHLLEVALEVPGDDGEFSMYYYNYFLTVEVLAP